MKYNIFGYLIGEGFGNVFKNKKSTGASLMIMCATMIIFGIFLILGENINHFVDQVKSEQGFQVFLNTDATEEEIVETGEKIRALNGVNTAERKTKARMYLGNMNVTREEMEGKIAELSNGTKAKLILMKLVLEKSNVLLLDEPTRNVSPLSNPVIRKVLKEFKGTIISVSHDRKYIEEVIDKLYTLTPNGLILEKL